MRISDWSSDVCSSDLLAVLDAPGVGIDRRGVALRDRPGAVAAVLRCVARRIGGEGVAVGGRGETPDGALMAVSELVLALDRSEEHTSELQSLMRISYAVFCLDNKNKSKNSTQICRSD